MLNSRRGIWNTMGTSKMAVMIDGELCTVFAQYLQGAETSARVLFNEAGLAMANIWGP